MQEREYTALLSCDLLSFSGGLPLRIDYLGLEVRLGLALFRCTLPLIYVLLHSCVDRFQIVQLAADQLRLVREKIIVLLFLL